MPPPAMSCVAHKSEAWIISLRTFGVGDVLEHQEGKNNIIQLIQAVNDNYKNNLISFVANR
jgi:hypothetical protein